MNEAWRFCSLFPTRRVDQAVALSQFVHLSCATRDNPCTAFPNREVIFAHGSG